MPYESDEAAPKMAVWIGCMSHYNDGRLVGRWVDAETNARLDAFAAEHDTTASSVIRDALNAYLPA